MGIFGLPDREKWDKGGYAGLIDEIVSSRVSPRNKTRGTPYALSPICPRAFP